MDDPIISDLRLKLKAAGRVNWPRTAEYMRERLPNTARPVSAKSLHKLAYGETVSWQHIRVQVLLGWFEANPVELVGIQDKTAA